MTFIAKNYEGVVPDGGDEGGPLSPNDEQDAEFISDINSLLQQYIDSLESVKLRQGLHLAMQISSRGNQYLQASGLNTALKKSEPQRCAQVLSRAINLIYVLSVLVEPFMHGTAAQVLSQLNAPQRTVPEVFSVDILPGHTIGKPAHLFKPIKEEMADVWRDKFAGTKKTTTQAGADATHVAPGSAAQPGVSKRKAAAAAKAAAKEAMYTGPKSPEVTALEEKVKQQGDLVRSLKSKPKTPEGDAEIAAAVDGLKKLKTELADAIKVLQDAQSA